MFVFTVDDKDLVFFTTTFPNHIFPIHLGPSLFLVISAYISNYQLSYIRNYNS